MQALRATSDELRLYPIVNAELTPYAGPQCFPQLQDRSRREANTVKAGVAAELSGDPARRQLTECWLKCDRCAKWRLVEQASLPALKTEEYVKKRDGCVEVDWGRWLAEAEARYDAFLLRHRAQSEPVDPETSVDQVDAAPRVPGDAECEIDEEQGCAEKPARNAAGVPSDASSSGAADVSECGSDDECRVAAGEGDDFSAAWDSALARLRSRGGGMTREERATQKRLAQAERSKELSARGSRGVLGRAPAEFHAVVRV